MVCLVCQVSLDQREILDFLVRVDFLETVEALVLVVPPVTPAFLRPPS